MCGIAGFNHENDLEIRRLTDLLRHRGPDQSGFHVSGGVSLGHRRLSILDLSEHGRQPIYNEDRTICVVFNGEVFNFPELKRQLESHGHRFASHTDTEVLVHGYEQWGEDLCRHLNGQFAFCIFDAVNRRLILARDHFGIKPLYYYAQGRDFFFCSELKCFLRSGYPREIDPLSKDHYLLFGFMPSGRTILKNVFQLLPGHRLTYDLQSNRCSVTRFWNWAFEPDETLSQAVVLPELRWRLETAVQRQLISDVPLGAFLSGGVDSSVLVSLMRQHVDQLKTFSIRFDRAEFNESQYAAVVSKMFETQHYEIEFNAEHVRELIGELACHYDEPFGDPSMIPTRLVSGVARQHVTVSLSGTGGDELFGGYTRYTDFGSLATLNHLPSPVRRLLDAGVAAANRFCKKDKLNKLRAFLGQRIPDPLLYGMLFSYMFRHPGESVQIERFGDDLAQAFTYDSPLDNMQNYDIRHYLPDCLFVKEDRAAMAVSLEVRVPFLDVDLAEFAFRLPARMRIHNGQKKILLKKAFAGILPDVILNRRKQGFGVPLVHYFRNELKDTASDILFGADDSDFMSRSDLETYWAGHQSGHSDYSRILWSAMMYKLWYRQWMR